MLETKHFSGKKILNMLRHLPESKRTEVLDFVDFLIQRVKNGEGQKDFKVAISAIEDTWGSIKLDTETIKYIAEDKELEYEI